MPTETRIWHCCRWMSGCFALVATIASVSYAEPPQLDHFYPAGGKVGTTVDVVASGKFAEWPVTGWTLSRGLDVKAAEEKGKVQIAIAADVLPGVHWVRLVSAGGASALRPFVVETVNELVEESLPSVPLDLAEPRVINGRLLKNNEVDSYSVMLQPGAELVASVMAHRHLRSPMDVVLQLYDRVQRVVVQQSDDAPGLDPTLVYRATRGGEYSLRLFAFPETPTATIGFAGGENFRYRLSLSTAGVVQYALPMSVPRGGSRSARVVGLNVPSTAVTELLPRLGYDTSILFSRNVPGWVDLPVVDSGVLVEEPDCTEGMPQPIALPTLVTGRIERPADEDWYRCYASRHRPMQVTVSARQAGSPIDALVSITDDMGKELVSSDDVAANRDSHLSFPVPADGYYRVRVRDLYGHGGDQFLYELRVEQAEPAFRASVDQDVLSGVVGAAFEIPITIARDEGFSEAVELVPIGLPESVKVVHAKSLPTGDSAAKVPIKVVAEQPFQGAFRIQAVAVDSGRGASVTAPTISPESRTKDMWLSVTAAQ